MVLFEGLTSSGKAKVLNVDDEGNLFIGSSPTPSGGLQEGTDISGAMMPAGGTSGRGWLSAIWLLISTRFPVQGQALASASTPVVLPASQITALTPPTTITANLDVTDSGYLSNLNTAIGTPVTGAAMPTGGAGWFGWLSAIWLLISTRFPVQGQALASASTPVVLPASQITALTPPTTITANLDVTDSGYLSNLNTAIGTPVTGAAMPTGGAGWFGWLSAIWLLISTRFPVQGQALASASTPVVLPASQITALTPPTTITANLDVTDSGYLSNLNTAIGTPVTGAAMPTGGAGWFGWLSAIWLLISTRFPVQGQALASASTPVVLPASQITALTPPTTITANLDVTDSGYLSNLNTAIGTPVTGAAMPTGGAGWFGWLSAIWLLISTRFPVQGQALASASTPVVLPASQITALTPPTTITANLDVTDSGYLSNLNTAIGTPVTGAAMPTGGAGWFGWLSAIWLLISTRFPVQGQALASASTPVVLPASQITALTPPTTITANLDVTDSGYLSNLNTAIGTPVTGAAMPTGGAGWFGWLSAIWLLISTKVPTLGQALAAGSTPVVLPASQITALTPPTTVTVTSGGFISTSTIQRAANVTPYTANDVYGAAFSLPNIVAVANANIILSSIDIIFNISAVPSGMSSLVLYLYSVTPPSAIADNGAFSLPSGDRASILTPTGISLGSAALATGGGTVVLEIDNLNLQFAPASTSLFGYLVTSGAFTPAANSETATIRARVLAV